MSSQQLKAFGELVSSSPDLQDQIKAASSPDELLAIAKQAGFAITPEEFDAAYAEASDGQDLTPDQLEAVAGGAGFGGIKAGLAIYGAGRTFGWW